MTWRTAIAALAALGLAACGDNGSSVMESAPPPPPPAPMAMMSAPAEQSFAENDVGAARKVDVVQQDPSGGQPGGDGQAQAGAGRLIAYSYARSFRAPTLRLEPLLNAHKAACESAGPAQCYVVSSNLQGLGTDYISGGLQLKASPAWITTFFAGLPEGLKPFDADLDGSNDWSEDLTTQIIDTGARLDAAKTLRTRLEALLKSRPGELKDLLEIERELARVQAEIDSTESVLAAMRLRVSMSDLSLGYQPKFSAASESVWRPLGDAFGGFFGTLAASLAAVVNFTAEILPWLIVVTGLGWFFVWLFRWFRRSRARQAAATNVAAND